MRAWLKRISLGVGLVAALGAIAFLVTALSQRQPSLDVKFAGYTHVLGQASFHISNRTDTPIKYGAWTEYPTSGKWPQHRPTNIAARNLSPSSAGLRLSVGAHQTDFYRLVYPKDGAPFRLVVVYLFPHTTWEKRRVRWAQWMTKHHLSLLARSIAPRPEEIELVSEEHKATPK